MEWFARPDGTVAISEIGARPPGAQISPMIGFAHDIDFYDLWARLGPHGRVRPPGPGLRLRHGIPAGDGARSGPHRPRHRPAPVASWATSSSARSSRSRGSPAATSYEGEGFVTVRHEDTDVVREALERIVSLARVEFVESD
jgi:hypothetical protein